MPPINNAEDALKIAEAFVYKYNIFHRLIKVARDKDKWIVEFDVAIIGTEIVRVVLDAQTGTIIEYGKVV